MALGRRVQRLADVVFAAPVGDYRVRLKECLRILGVLESAPSGGRSCRLDDAEREHLLAESSRGRPARRRHDRSSPALV